MLLENFALQLSLSLQFKKSRLIATYELTIVINTITLDAENLAKNTKSTMKMVE